MKVVLVGFIMALIVQMPIQLCKLDKDSFFWCPSLKSLHAHSGCSKYATEVRKKIPFGLILSKCSVPVVPFGGKKLGYKYCPTYLQDGLVGLLSYFCKAIIQQYKGVFALLLLEE